MKKSICCLGALGILISITACHPQTVQPTPAEKAAATAPEAPVADATASSPAGPGGTPIQAKVAAPGTVATATQQKIMQLLHLPLKEHQGGCLRSVIDQDMTGREMFALEKCPLVKTADLEILPETEQPGASRGKLRISMACTVKNNDYYAGKLNKTFDQDVEAAITADYVYALDDLSLKNVVLEGDKFCAHPVRMQIKKYE